MQIWLYSFCSPHSTFVSEVSSALMQAGITVRTHAGDESRGPGLVIVDAADPDMVEFVRTSSQNGVRRVLVALGPGNDCASEDGWQLLDAGASDVLTWHELPNPGRVIAARLERWQKIDALVESPLVRQNLIGQSRTWRSILRRLVEAACFTDTPVLLYGETGTGKELAARLIHTLDPRRKEHELVTLDCTTIVPELSGSELFGHERGAFTGAVAARDGAFALADGGTLFLDEIGELPAALQVQLLRVLQEHTYKRVGSNVWQRSDFRLICATNRDLREDEQQGKFRRDLYYRLASWSVTLPPLRQRVEDIIPLARHFLREVRPGEEPPPLDSRVRSYLETRPYPGNVRDLRNLILQIAARHVGEGPITMGDIPTDERPAAPPTAMAWCDRSVEQALRRALASGLSLRTIRHTVDDAVIRLVVEEEAGSLQQAADRLHVSLRTLQKWRADHRDGAMPAVSFQPDAQVAGAVG